MGGGEIEEATKNDSDTFSATPLCVDGWKESSRRGHVTSSVVCTRRTFGVAAHVFVHHTCKACLKVILEILRERAQEPIRPNSITLTALCALSFWIGEMQTLFWIFTCTLMP